MVMRPRALRLRKAEVRKMISQRKAQLDWAAISEEMMQRSLFVTRSTLAAYKRAIYRANEELVSTVERRKARRRRALHRLYWAWIKKHWYDWFLICAFLVFGLWQLAGYYGLRN